MNASGDGKSQVLAATDIVQLIGQSVKLIRRGGKFLGLCPFHQEKSPSFTVDPGKQLFYCFGCKAGGTCFDFVMKRDRVEFREALQILARAANIDLPQGSEQRKNTGERQQLLSACSAAVALFDNLLQHATTGRPAREYLAQRGFTPELLRKFSVGFAPDSWDSLLSSLGKKFSPAILHLAGLVKQRDGGTGFYDTFRNRVIFPIRDETGRTIAFGGRVMPGSDAPAKYLNSPETPLFHKSKSVFGLDLAKQKIVETRTVAVVEGYTDVVMAHQYGASNVVSILGTAMTEQHVNILRRFADRIVLLFDADAAGDSAVNRTVELFLTQPIEIAVASIPQGLDPDEFIMRDGVDAFNALLDDADDALTFKWRLMQKQFDAAGSLTGEQNAIAAYLDVLAGARGSATVDGLRWGTALGRVSKLTGMPIEELNRRFRSGPRQASRARARMTDVSRATDNQAGNPTAEAQEEKNAQVRAEQQLLGVLLLNPQNWLRLQATVQPVDFSTGPRRLLAEIFWEVCRHDGELSLAEFLTILPDEPLRQLAMELAHEVEAFDDLEQTLAGAVQHLQEARHRAGEALNLAQIRTGNVRSENLELELPPGEDAEVALLRQLAEKSGRPDMRRGLL
ncbi:MAG TPA: DNA primase [Tepidisphaeraceae bacterium]|nr:DNA primase [Tepidisphaeraceae bacterium]